MGHPSLDLTAKTAVVIGGTSGIGLTLAIGLAEAGANVVPTGRRADLVQAAVEQIQKLGRRSLAVECNVTQRESVEALHSAVCAEFDHVDILINSAGVIRRVPTLEVSEKEWN